MADFDESQQSPDSKGGSRIIGRILPGAVKLWLRSQLQKAGQLDIQLDGRDREILSGRIPKVAVTAQGVIYQGIQLGAADLSAEDIRINIGQVLRGKPLKLLKGFPVLGEVALSAEDLNASMGSSLLLEGLTDFWRGVEKMPQFAEEIQGRYGKIAIAPDVVLNDVTVALAENCLGLSFYPSRQGEMAAVPVVLRASLSVVSGHILQVSSAKWLSQLSELNDPTKGTVIQSLEGYEWDLGKDTQLSQLSLHSDRLLCAGQLQVRP